MVSYLNVVIGLGVGALVVIQGGMNARLLGAVGGTVPTSFINFTIGAIALLAATIVTGQLSSVHLLSQAPRWSLIGGCAGALLVMGTAFIIPRIGTANTVALLVCGQALMSLVFDHFGLLGVPVMQITLNRMVGCGLLALGALLIGR